MDSYKTNHRNESFLLKSIIDNQEISRTELAKVTKLTKSSISDITKTLLKDKLVYEGDTGDSTFSGGRRPVYLKFNDKSALVIGIEIGNNYINSCLSYINGKIIEEKNYVNIKIDQNNITEILIKIICFFQENTVPTPYGIVGIGIAIHGSVYKNKILFTPYSNIDKINIFDELNAVVGLPIILINEANASALGEYTFSSNSENLVSINIQNGIGAGIVEEGILYTGRNGNAGEIGHSILYPNGKQCPCGNQGCLEQYASIVTLYDEISAQKGSELTIDDIAECWNQKDDTIVKLLKKHAKLISIGVNNIVTLYDPEIIIINNELYRKIPNLINIIEENLQGKNTKNVQIKNTILDNKSVLYGCISLIVSQFLKIDKLKIDLKINE